MTQDQHLSLIKLLDLRDNIFENLLQIESILKKDFPHQYEVAYQHWIPQITTSLYNNTKWLPRGQVTFQDSIDQIKDNSTSGSGVSKFIK